MTIWSVIFHCVFGFTYAVFSCNRTHWRVTLWVIMYFTVFIYWDGYRWEVSISPISLVNPSSSGDLYFVTQRQFCFYLIHFLFIFSSLDKEIFYFFFGRIQIQSFFHKFHNFCFLGYSYIPFFFSYSYIIIFFHSSFHYFMSNFFCY